MASHSLYLVHVLHVPCRITASPTIPTSQTSTLWALHLRRPTVTLDSAMRRTARGSFAYRHTSERVSQHYCIRRANLYTLLIKLFMFCSSRYWQSWFFIAVLFFMPITIFSVRLRARPPISLRLCNRSPTCTFTQPTFAPMDKSSKHKFVPTTLAMPSIC